MTSATRRSVISSALALALAGVFFAFFQFTKQDAALSRVNASGVDPYDAIGSFGIQAAAFLGALSVLRAYLWGRNGLRSSEQETLLVRTQGATILAVAVTLAGDVVAMLRHPSVWFGVPEGSAYAAALLAVAVVAALVGARVFAGSPRSDHSRAPAPRAAWIRAGVGALVFLVVLAFYPETVTSSIPGALLTVIAGVVLLFVPMRFFTLAFAPHPCAEPVAPTPAHPRGLGGRQWALVGAIGVLAGLALVAVELLADGGGAPPQLARIVLVVSVYVGLETSGLLIGYALLRGPLGLGQRPGYYTTARPA